MQDHDTYFQYILLALLGLLVIAPCLVTVPTDFSATYNGVIMAILAALNLRGGK